MSVIYWRQRVEIGQGIARPLRLQYLGAMHHVINHGNYQGDVFATDGAKEAFLACLEPIRAL